MKNQIKSSTGRKKVQQLKPATRKNSIKQPNWNMNDMWERHGAPLYRNKIQPLMTNKKMVTAGISAVACFALGVFSLAQTMPALSDHKVINATIEKAVQVKSDPQYIPDDAETLDMYNLSAMMKVQKPLEVSIDTYALMINGSVVGNFENQAACEEILSQVVSTYSDQADAKLENAEFKEKVTITQVNRFVGSFSRYDDPALIAQFILKGNISCSLERVFGP